LGQQKQKNGRTGAAERNLSAVLALATVAMPEDAI